jgi:transmembrane sensor
MDQLALIALIKKYRNGETTAEETLLLQTWWLAITWQEELPAPDADEAIFYKQAIWQGIQQQTGLTRNLKPAKTVRLWQRIAVAASVLFLLSAGAYFILHRDSKTIQVAIRNDDVAPGSNQATLTLANGKKIILTKGLNGKLAQQGSTVVQVSRGNAITYLAAKGQMTESVSYNTLSTVRGQQSPYPLILSDGTKVWLNAASSITFPTAFNGKERRVVITGEAYFEVQHNSAQPFFVTAMGQTVEDLGTAFNINAYEDEPVVRTTLIQGKIEVSNGKQKMRLSPGQQAVNDAAHSHINTINVDTEEAMAWKNGYFSFDHENLESVMRKVSRWYDVDVEFTSSTLKQKDYWGSMSRYSNVSKVLHTLEMAGDVRFKITGRKIIAAPKQTEYN